MGEVGIQPEHQARPWAHPRPGLSSLFLFRVKIAATMMHELALHDLQTPDFPAALEASVSVSPIGRKGGLRYKEMKPCLFSTEPCLLSVTVCSGCHSKIPQTERLNTRQRRAQREGENLFLNQMVNRPLPRGVDFGCSEQHSNLETVS